MRRSLFSLLVALVALLLLVGCDPTSFSKRIDPDEALPHYGMNAPENPH